MPIGAIASVAGPLLGGIIGNITGQDDKSKALALQQQALDNISKINTPDLQSLQVALQKIQSAGQLDPEMIQTISQDPSLLKDISVDPRLRNAQMQAMQTMQNIGQGGLRPEDQAALAKIKSDVESQENANRQSILQNMQQRGLGGSGAELAAQLSNSQSAANRASQQGLDIAGQASQRALQAIYNSGQLGSSMEGQQFSEDAQKAAAQDAINRYNAMNSQQIAGTNTGAKNQAQATNLQNAQNIINQNASTENQQRLYNAQLPMTVFNANLSKAQAGANATGQAANAYNQQAAQNQSMWGGLGQAVGQVGSAYAQQEATKQQQATQAQQNKDYLDVLKKAYGK